MTDREIDEVLEALWVCVEKDDVRIDALAAECDVPVGPGSLEELEALGLVVFNSDMALLSAAGMERAAGVIRRHRLAERLFADVLGMPRHRIESGACEFEHMVDAHVEEGICTLLGHPRECPHGAPIPPGRCCDPALDAVRKAVVPLSALGEGAAGKVLYVTSGRGQRLDRLLALGLGPGAAVRVLQTSPAFVVSSGKADVALEEDVAGQIHVLTGGRRDP